MNNHDKKKILYVITKSNWGGAQKYVYELATHLPQDEFEVAVTLGGTGTTGAPPGMLQNKLHDAGIRTIVIPHFMRDMSLGDDMRAFRELLAIIRVEKPDILHVTSSKAGGLGGLAGRIAGVPTIVFTSHGLAYDESWRPLWQRVLIYAGTWNTIALSSKTIQITHDTHARAQRIPLIGNRSVLVHNGIRTPEFHSKEEAQSALLKNAGTAIQSQSWIGSIAEYHPNKNLHILIEAIALLKNKGHTAHLILIGDGEERAHLASLAEKLDIKDQVHLVGFVNEAARYLPALDIFTLPSKKEGLPYVLLEAGLAKLPVVVSNIPGVRDIVTHEKTGLIVEATPEKFSEAFLMLLQDNVMRAHYADNLYAHVRTTFSIEKMTHETQALYVATNPSTSRSSSSRRTFRS